MTRVRIKQCLIHHIPEHIRGHEEDEMYFFSEAKSPHFLHITLYASTSQPPLLSVCVWVVWSPRQSPHRPPRHRRLAAPSPWLTGTFGREKSRATFLRSTYWRLFQLLPLRSRPRRGGEGKECGKVREECRSRWTGRDEKGKDITERVKTQSGHFGRQRSPSVWCTKHLTWTLLCLSSSYTWIMRDI